MMADTRELYNNLLFFNITAIDQATHRTKWADHQHDSLIHI
ncbi:hypothetical protein C8D90_105148 [Enterobacillus tribolii]|uniref:Uncharacterized protein n=1 Tax=Enterobacillus tribolii TaxID=1487935 RepID=A0A370QR09_9GAMM|nr:hypothetical protein C8D90_105148 [Enterobacillus tribolii]